ncbi:class I SAM-dependent methyltransferase [Tahibacter harae]|uniref:Methyltransferase n=1 Tax=Tahibacter harae TaxID=2963937 RepID=A0ABT1QTK4_9GAMM|nr:methyltransferase [Tahibacter harae]MCQ4165604.1 methyltransferase [Tahibacter harae]
MQKLALPFALTLVLAACGGNNEPAKPAAPEPAKPAAPAAAPATPAPTVAPEVAAWEKRMDEVLAGSWRSDANKARDAHRHPRETLAFFGLKPGQVVIEVTPGGGWYTEILAPLEKGVGRLAVALVDSESASSEGTKNYLAKSNAALQEKLAGDKERYGEVEVRQFAQGLPKFGDSNSADVVLTFRNVHNFMNWNSDKALFQAAFDVLKPGGVLGVTDHRAAPGSDIQKIKDSGYIPEEYVIKLATDAGFVLEAKSEINANPKDTKDYEKGVWTLPPSLALGDKDKEKYVAIGESDRMTLKFVKPAGTAAAPAAAPAPAPAAAPVKE